MTRTPFPEPRAQIPQPDQEALWHRVGAVTVPWRAGRRMTVTPLARAILDAMRSVLIDAAAHRETITYGQLARACGGRYRPVSMGRLLDLLAMDCAERGEPSLAALVVSASTDEVGSGYGGDAAAERQRCYRLWAQTKD